jgi:serine/threonine-protein kinase
LPVCPPCRAKIREQNQSIAGYQIVRELGRGGMGVVYLALREADGAVVALKTILPANAGTKLQIERFLREARILGQLDHPHIVPFREMGRSGDMLYFAMDYVPGSDVAALQKKVGGPLPIPRAVDLTCQMLSALEYAHAKGFVHRDIKPANMLVEQKEGKDVVRVTDFGLARTYQTSPLSGLTMQGFVGGTMAFAAPEQITNFRDAKPPVDQYAAGATLYTLLTGKFVFDLPRHFEQQILMILQDEPVPIRKRRAEVPAGLAAVVHRSLAKDPKARFSHVGAVRSALASFARGR